MIALAFDLGASSGKAVAGRFDGQRLHVSEVHRFQNDPVRASGRLHWDILRLLHEIKVGIGTAANAGLGEIESLAIDAWGCDFGLLDCHGELIGNPHHYRDELARGAMEEMLQIVPRPEIFSRTGCQFLPINTLYQLFALRRARAETLERADTLLLIPDLLRYLLTGERSSESTIASTTQFLGIANGDWDRALLERLGLPTNLLTAIVAPATPAGRLLPELAGEIGCEAVQVPAVAGHDTASAVAAVPADGRFAFLSSGTWSLLGTELQRPIVDERALQLRTEPRPGAAAEKGKSSVPWHPGDPRGCVVAGHGRDRDRHRADLAGHLRQESTSRRSRGHDRRQERAWQP